METKYSVTLPQYFKMRQQDYIEGSCMVGALPTFMYLYRCSSLQNSNDYFDFDIRDCCKKHNIEPPSWPYNISRLLTDLSKKGVFNNYDKFRSDFGFIVNKNLYL